MAVLQHEHSLSLVDLNPTYPYVEKVYDDEEDLIIKQAFQIPCNRCHQKITYFHRYYYKCDQCDYVSHKLCAELPTRLEHASHISHTLTLYLDESQWQCYMCESVPRFNQVCYHCSHCSFNICLDCGMNRVQYHSIYHSSHKHPLIPFHRHKEILAECEACGEEHKGIFYHCVTCFHCFIHKDCVFQPKRLLIQDGTCGRYFHTHPLILTYSFPQVEQEARFNPLCRVCDDSFSNYEKLWVYKCDKCRYYVHLHCASLRDEPSNSGMDITQNNYEDDPKIVHLPLPDRTYNVIRDFLLKKTNKTIIHDSHEHPLTLVDAQSYDTTTPVMTKVERFCNGCICPLINMPYYECSMGCYFFLHDWCTRLPAEFKDHIGTRHTLVFSPKQKYKDTLVFSPKGKYEDTRPDCDQCHDYCYGFAYSSVNDKGDYRYMDVACALIPWQITHPSHPYHRLVRVSNVWLHKSHKNYCRICLSGFTGEQLLFSCRDRACHFHLHLGCGILFPTTIKHKYDKHPMALSCRPIENHDGDYFCEVCEEELNPHISFYHCRDCVQSVHTTCTPLPVPHNIIQKINISVHEKAVKYNDTYETKDHEHLISLWMLISESHQDPCIKCGKIFGDYDINLGCNTILKCFRCYKFSIHRYCLSDYPVPVPFPESAPFSEPIPIPNLEPSPSPSPAPSPSPSPTPSPSPSPTPEPKPML